MLNKTWVGVWGKFLVSGTASAGVISIYILGKIVKFILDTGIHAVALYEIYGFSFHLLGAVWDSVTQLSTGSIPKIRTRKNATFRGN